MNTTFSRFALAPFIAAAMLCASCVSVMSPAQLSTADKEAAQSAVDGFNFVRKGQAESAGWPTFGHYVAAARKRAAAGLDLTPEELAELQRGKPWKGMTASAFTAQRGRPIYIRNLNVPGGVVSYWSYKEPVAGYPEEEYTFRDNVLVDWYIYNEKH